LILDGALELRVSNKVRSSNDNDLRAEGKLSKAPFKGIGDRSGRYRCPNLNLSSTQRRLNQSNGLVFLAYNTRVRRKRIWFYSIILAENNKETGN
jgi:hypothetical protein